MLNAARRSNIKLENDARTNLVKLESFQRSNELTGGTRSAHSITLINQRSKNDDDSFNKEISLLLKIFELIRIILSKRELYFKYNF